MLMPDVNVLVYAHRADEASHVGYARWLANLIDGPEPFALSVLVAVGFVRIVTNSKIYRAPTPFPTALAAVDLIVAYPNCRTVTPGADHWKRVADLCRATGAMGKMVTDAQHAALAIEEGCVFVTRDSDFSRFVPHGLRWQHLSP